MRIARCKLDERLVAVFVLESRRATQDAVGHLLEIAVSRDHDGHGIFLHLRLKTHFNNIDWRDQTGLTRRHVLFVHCRQLTTDNVFDFLLATQRGFKLGNFALELGNVLSAIKDVLFVDVAQLNLCHKLSLNLVDTKASHEVRHNVNLKLSATNNGNGLVDVEQNCLKAMEQVQAVALLLQVKRNAAARRIHAPSNPLFKNLTHTHHARVAIY